MEFTAALRARLLNAQLDFGRRKTHSRLIAETEIYIYWAWRKCKLAREDLLAPDARHFRSPAGLPLRTFLFLKPHCEEGDSSWLTPASRAARVPEGSCVG
jgi:hypothetical protein